MLIGYVASFIVAVLLTPSGDPYSINFDSVPLFLVSEAFSWAGYVRGSKHRT
jgi:hypothetical protein